MLCARECKVRAKRIRTRGKENHTTLTRTHAHHHAQEKNYKGGRKVFGWGGSEEAASP